LLRRSDLRPNAVLEITDREMNYSDVIAAFDKDGAFKGRVADNWLQGRTVYGGLTAALCLEGAL